MPVASDGETAGFLTVASQKSFFFFCIGLSGNHANTLVIVCTARGSPTGGRRGQKLKKRNIRAHPCMFAFAPCMNNLHGVGGLVWLNKTARITLVLPRAEPSKSRPRKNPQKNWRHSVDFQRNAGTSLFARTCTRCGCLVPVHAGCAR
jgi:hypothetical protein